ncbi:MAG: hypothetical protein LAT62_10465 [Natronospirillum sp.]|uniref:hypothetical protein n=1 Tax=Natronospirillum sp. TaxID=2812955 RepID=UPI0025E9B741|nr:hypothetical protein [Natronospirillum sp.]MCH8552350.1 hypothetical protein [Natronospirillum sp.]
MTNTKQYFTAGLLTFLVTLAGCNDDNGNGGDSSDSSYSGSTEAATVDQDNGEAIARGTVTAAQRAIGTDSAQDAAPFTPNSHDMTTSTNVMEDILNHTGLLPEDADFSARSGQDAICDAGGSVDFDTSQSPGGNDPEGEMTITYDNCSINTPDGVANIDGVIDFEWTETDWAFRYNVTYSYRGETYNLNSTFSCSDIGTADLSCNLSETYSDNGTEYQITDSFVVENTNGDYDVDAKLYHEEHGYVTFESTGLQLCSGGGFSHGTVEVTDSSDDVVLTLEFNQDCETMVATYDDGTTETITY